MAVAIIGKAGRLGAPIPEAAAALLASVATRISPAAADLLVHHLAAAGSSCEPSLASTHDGSGEVVTHPSGIRNVLREPRQVPLPRPSKASPVLFNIMEEPQAETADDAAFWTHIGFGF